MRRKALTALCAALVVFAFGTMTVGHASGANMTVKGAAEGFLAVFGSPPTTGPVGGGIAREVGFGQNMLFQASTGKIGANLSFTTPGGVTSESCDSFIGGSLVSNKTGENNPLSVSIQFADFQCNKVAGALTPAYASFQQYQQQWRTTICPKVEGATCKPDAIIAGGAKGLVKIENVAIDIGPGAGGAPGIVVQGTIWGESESGAAGKPPCIKLTEPSKEASEKEPDQTLIVTQSNSVAAKVGEKITTVKGQACLISANNNWYAQTEKSEPAIEILNNA